MFTKKTTRNVNQVINLITGNDANFGNACYETFRKAREIETTGRGKCTSEFVETDLVRLFIGSLLAKEKSPTFALSLYNQYAELPQKNYNNIFYSSWNQRHALLGALAFNLIWEPIPAFFPKDVYNTFTLYHMPTAKWAFFYSVFNPDWRFNIQKVVLVTSPYPMVKFYWENADESITEYVFQKDEPAQENENSFTIRRQIEIPGTVFWLIHEMKYSDSGTLNDVLEKFNLEQNENALPSE